MVEKLKEKRLHHYDNKTRRPNLDDCLIKTRRRRGVDRLTPRGFRPNGLDDDLFDKNSRRGEASIGAPRRGFRPNDDSIDERRSFFKNRQRRVRRDCDETDTTIVRDKERSIIVDARNTYHRRCDWRIEYAADC